MGSLYRNGRVRSYIMILLVLTALLISAPVKKLITAGVNDRISSFTTLLHEKTGLSMAGKRRNRHRQASKESRKRHSGTKRGRKRHHRHQIEQQPARPAPNRTENGTLAPKRAESGTPAPKGADDSAVKTAEHLPLQSCLRLCPRVHNHVLSKARLRVLRAYPTTVI